MTELWFNRRPTLQASPHIDTAGLPRKDEVVGRYNIQHRELAQIIGCFGKVRSMDIRKDLGDYASCNPY